MRTQALAAANGKSGLSHSPDGWVDPCNVEGVILLDFSQQILAVDAGAAAILREWGAASENVRSATQLPSGILEMLRGGITSNGLSRRLRIRVANRAYICRIHTVRTLTNCFPENVTLLHLARDLTVADALAQIAAEYRLTSREKETLEGVLMGLSSKEVAGRMGISPNTVKAFLRLVMGKMGVASRAGIVAKLFEPNGHG